jgi:L-2-hydroxyglutarate oxidase LhgO
MESGERCAFSSQVTRVIWAPYWCRYFAAALARLIPAIEEADLVPCAAGVRAQAVAADGTLVDDFLIETAPHQVHVLNAPSPAATSALEIAKAIAARVPDVDSSRQRGRSARVSPRRPPLQQVL